MHAGANLQIYFKKEYQHSGFPYTLKANLIGKVSELGGGSWDVYGLQDQGSSNDVRESAGSYRIKMYWLQLTRLYAWAEKLKGGIAFGTVTGSGYQVGIFLVERRLSRVLLQSE